MIKDKTYIKARELLFTRILIVATVFVTLVSLLNLYSQKFQELYFSMSFLVGITFVWISFTKISKQLAFHILLWILIILLCYPILFQGKSYYAAIIYPIASLIYNFVFFDNKKILWIYFVLMIFIEFVLLSSVMQVEYSNIPVQFFAEFMNALTYMTCLFFIGNFFISNIKSQENELNIAKADINEKQNELIKKNETLDKYIESNVQLENFAHLAAHELKAPLRSVTGFAGLLHRKIKNKLTPEEDNMFGLINTSNRQMHDMVGAINQLGSVSKMNINLSEFIIQDLISEILFDRKDANLESGAKVDQNISFTLIVADRTLLKQLLSNLIGNALKFVSTGEAPEIQISAEMIENNYVFQIEDKGIGIKAEDQEKIFDLFVRLNSSKSFNGSGIGLAICKKIVELHHGNIKVESNNPKGSRFIISIPSS